MITIIFLCIM